MLQDIFPVLGQTFARKLTRAWNRSATFLQNVTFYPGGGEGNGGNIKWAVQFRGATARSFSEGAPVDPSEYSADREVPATLSWGKYRAAFRLTHDEINIARMNVGNPEEIDKLFDERLFGAVTTLTEQINRDALTGTGIDAANNPTLIGIIPALQATGTYATISKATYPDWAGNVVGNGGVSRPLSLSLLARADQLLFTAAGTSAEYILTSAGVHMRYEALFESVQRLVNDGRGPIPAMHGGAKRMFWRGVEIEREKDMPPGTMVMLRPSGVEMRVLPWVRVPDGVPMTLRELISSPGTNGAQKDDPRERMLGSFLNVYPLGKRGSSVEFAVEIMLQLKICRPNEHALVLDIDEA